MKGQVTWPFKEFFHLTWKNSGTDHYPKKFADNFSMWNFYRNQITLGTLNNFFYLTWNHKNLIEKYLKFFAPEEMSTNLFQELFAIFFHFILFDRTFQFSIYLSHLLSISIDCKSVVLPKFQGQEESIEVSSFITSFSKMRLLFINPIEHYFKVVFMEKILNVIKTHLVRWIWRHFKDLPEEFLSLKFYKHFFFNLIFSKYSALFLFIKQKVIQINFSTLFLNFIPSKNNSNLILRNFVFKNFLMLKI